MKLNPNYIVHKTETETVLVPLGGSPFTGIGRGNATLGELLSLLEQDPRPSGRRSLPNL